MKGWAVDPIGNQCASRARIATPLATVIALSKSLMAPSTWRTNLAVGALPEGVHPEMLGGASPICASVTPTGTAVTAHACVYAPAHGSAPRVHLPVGELRDRTLEPLHHGASVDTSRVHHLAGHPAPATPGASAGGGR